MPQSPDWGDYVGSTPEARAALVQLGKALFWDEQVGSDRQACASCHFHAGVDNRSKNQLNPGHRRDTSDGGGDSVFGNTPLAVAGRPFAPNYQLTGADFPLTRHQDENVPGSPIVQDTNDIVSSQGVFAADFVSAGLPVDAGTAIAWQFNVGGVLVRNVEPRNTPTTINAVFNDRQFWDGRARSTFNGVNPLGELDPDARIVSVVGGVPSLVQVRIRGSSLASQAVGPVLNDMEMSYRNRYWAAVGRKLLSATALPLAFQRVHSTDSVLGALSRDGVGDGRGIDARYADLIRAAFLPRWWDAPNHRVIPGNPATIVASTASDETHFTVMEYNFSLFFGLAVDAYQRTLVSTDTRFDRFMGSDNSAATGDNDALDDEELRGLQIFSTLVGGPLQADLPVVPAGGCVACHQGPEMTTASARIAGIEPIERMVMGNGNLGIYDVGFYNIGVRPTAEDLAVGGLEGGNDLSNAINWQECVTAWLIANPTGTNAEANLQCGVPRIRAIPPEALILLVDVAAVVGDPPDVVALLQQAADMLALFDIDPTLDLMAASQPLFDAHALLLAYVDAFPEIQARLDEALLVLPDPTFSPQDPLAPVAPLLLANERIAARGAFKTPSLRNVALTAPYFHNGGKATLEQVVQFYNRGGDFSAQNIALLDPGILPLGLTAQDQAAVVKFLEALTDERVRHDSAPFDHPSLSIPNGGTPGRLNFAYFSGIGVLDDRVELPAVGAAGSQQPLGTPDTAFANFLQPLAPASRAIRPATDMDGDLKADILWRNTASGLVYHYGMNGPTIATAAPVTTTSAEWTIAGRGDFDGDGRSDILWLNGQTGLVYLYLMEGASIGSAAPVTTVAPGWQVAAVADLDGDGKADILWRHATSGMIYAYLMDGASIASALPVTTVSAEWQIAGTGDFGGDGRSDILWFNTETGLVYLYEMEGAAIRSSVPITSVALDWSIAGVGDLDGDTKADVLWQNSVSGLVYLHRMDGGTIVGAEPITTVGPGWAVADLADYDGTGTADILWRHDTTGEIYLYGMNGAVIGSSAPVATVEADWLVAR